jgi:uncharacterized protein YdhG (YjbR/CyaY superfamily)
MCSIQNVEPNGSLKYHIAMADTVSNVDDYIAGFPVDVQRVLEGVRAAIHASVPDGEEKIRYGMPAVMLGGRYAIHFAGWKHHVGLYPVPDFDGELEAEVAPFRSKKDSVTFPYAKPVPLDLVTRIAAEIVRQRGAASAD